MMGGTGEIFHLLAGLKTLVGVPKWHPNRENTVRLKVTLAVEGAVRPGLILDINANTHTIDQHGGINLIYHNIVIERLNYHPHDVHVNRLGIGPLSGKILPSGEHRYYAWENNAFLGWPRETKVNLAVADLLPDPLPTFAEALAYFFKRAHIVGDIAPPPYDPLLL
ncbi:MAG: hypothetical protein HQL45_04500 [Alphaproteobacteria bacterium]|nr:hypothetical protein [Alphaproteobacteria bacterium]